MLQTCGRHVAELDDSYVRFSSSTSIFRRRADNLIRSSEWRQALHDIASALGGGVEPKRIGSDLEVARSENEGLHEEVRSCSATRPLR